MARRGTSTFSALLVVLMLLFCQWTDAQLVQNYYARTCPNAEGIAQAIVRGRVGADRSIAASLLRLHFHDCLVMGCEGSVLIDSTPGNLAEKDAAPNANSLRGFDIIDQIKSAVESSCPGVVSCSDIVALAARDAISFIGGPSWSVPTGRRDGGLSSAAQASRSLPDMNQNFNQLLKTFQAAGLNQKDVVVLSAAHTIGTTSCAKIAPRLYNFPGSKDGMDPSLNKAYAQQLRKSCPPGSANRVPMDPTRGGQAFDTSYYSNLYNNMGLFHSDEALLSTTTSRSEVASELANSRTFFQDFGNSMQKMGSWGVLTTSSPYTGEIRLNCHRVNGVPPRRNSQKRVSKKMTKRVIKKRSKKSKK